MIAESRLCPLCGAPAGLSGHLPTRPFFACCSCGLHFVPSEFHLSPAQEYRRYLLHRNSLTDAGYVTFLMGAVESLKTHVISSAGRPARVLDYGSGPTPVLVQLLNKEGFLALGYDPYFGDQAVPGCELTAHVPNEGLFDAVVSNETVEHFRNPGKEWAAMVSLLRPRGVLVIVTRLVLPGVDLASWYYAGDPTHIAFYSLDTFRHIGETFGLTLVETDERKGVVMQKSAGA